MLSSAPAFASDSALPFVLMAVGAVLAAVAAPVCVYLLTLTAFAWPRAPMPIGRGRRLVAVVPAHNEELGIGTTVQSLLQTDYPTENRRVLVVADNCTDATAERARAAGADVLERHDDVRRGKGYALEAAFTHLLSDTFAEGALVIDADTVVASNIFTVLAGHLDAGALAAQTQNLIGNPDAGWRARLTAIGLALMNGVRSLGRERLHLSVGLRGNGMFLSRTVLERFPHRAHGLVEDVEQGIALALEGVRVVFAGETRVTSEAPVSAQAASSQRRRWEGGRLQLARTALPSVWRAFWQRPSWLLFDIACDLLVPPLTYPVLAVCGAGALTALAVVLGAPAAAAWVPAAEAAALVLYILRGVAVSGTGLRGLFTLAAAPVYILWKLVIVRPWGNSGAWVRTRRIAEDGAQNHKPQEPSP